MSNTKQAELSPAFSAWVRQIASCRTSQSLGEDAQPAVRALIGATMVEAWVLMTRHPEYAAALLAEAPEDARSAVGRVVDEGVALFPIERTDG